MRLKGCGAWGEGGREKEQRDVFSVPPHMPVSDPQPPDLGNG